MVGLDQGCCRIIQKAARERDLSWLNPRMIGHLTDFAISVHYHELETCEQYHIPTSCQEKRGLIIGYVNIDI